MCDHFLIFFFVVWLYKGGGRMLLLVLHLVLFLSAASSSGGCDDLVNCGSIKSPSGSDSPKLRLDPCADTATDGSCNYQIIINNFLDYDGMVIIPVRECDGKLLDDSISTILSIGTGLYRDPCAPAFTFGGRYLQILSNCSSDVLRSGNYYQLRCGAPKLNNATPDYYYDTTMRPGLYHLNCTTLIYSPFGEEWNGGGIWDAVEVGLDVSWALKDAWCDVCVKSGGSCTNNSFLGTSCHYSYRFAYPKNRPPQGQHKDKPVKKIMFGGFALAGFVLLLFFSLCFYRRLNLQSPRKDKTMEAFLEKFGKLVPARYSYPDVEEITSSFGHKLGQGGCGSVYRGKLKDGRPVAVKVLNDSKGSVKDFFNEVISIGCTYHVNIVTLLGFCSEGPRRVLIYEFMSKGSLEKFIYSDKQEATTSSLDGSKLLQIAIGVARGLEYLHHGCNIGILHFDIKPHNILLDHEFCPKIADFGLAKLCRSADGMIKMLGARGTIGYIAPEVFSRSYGAVSSKSDVYSYGMMLLEMVGGRKNCSVREDHTSEIYLPHRICKHLDLDGNLKSFKATTKAEEEITRRMVIVGLRCIQTKPSDRPSMTKVLDMLEGRIAELQMPVLSSSPRSVIRCLSSECDDEKVSVVTS